MFLIDAVQIRTRHVLFDGVAHSVISKTPVHNGPIKQNIFSYKTDFFYLPRGDPGRGLHRKPPGNE